MNVSTRGSAESVIVALVLLTIHLYQQKVFLLTGLVYGLAIHLKIYPLIFCLSLYVPLTQRAGLLSLFDTNVARCVTKIMHNRRQLVHMQDTIGFWHSLQPSHAYSPVPSRLWVAIHWGNLPLPYHKVLYIYNLDHPSASFRKDSRHNFSVYFYMLYLTVGDDDIGLNVLTFLPQVVLLLLLTYKYSSIYEVNFCIFCQTLVFVTFNKVRLLFTMYDKGCQFDTVKL